ncbi:hypothetical protein KVP97_09355 [Escherichia coli]|nr:hypothetical protein [Escherichia coli]
MAKRRFVSTSKTEIRSMTAQELKKSIFDSEGRVILAQNYVAFEGLCEGTTNAELDQALGADMIFFNGYSMDPENKMPGMQVEEYDEERGYSTHYYRLPDMRKVIDIPMGIYLECGTGDDISTSTSANGSSLVRSDRIASRENLQRVKEEGADFVVLGGNPGTRTSFETIIKSTRYAKEILGDDVLIFAGKWEDGAYAKVLGDPLADRPANDVIKDLIDAGADVICLPMPGSRTGITPDMIRECVEFTHRYKPGTLAMNFLDGSVEGADVDTIRQCALLSKQTGADIHAIGDAGLSGVTLPENLYQLSITIKGRRLTYRRMAGSRR